MTNDEFTAAGKRWLELYAKAEAPPPEQIEEFALLSNMLMGELCNDPSTAADRAATMPVNTEALFGVLRQWVEKRLATISEAR